MLSQIFDVPFLGGAASFRLGRGKLSGSISNTRMFTPFIKMYEKTEILFSMAEENIDDFKDLPLTTPK